MRHWLLNCRSSYPVDRWLVFNAPKAFEHPACQIRVSACRHHMKPLLKIRAAQRHRRRAGELFCGPLIDRAVSTGNDRLRSPVCVAEAAIADDFDAPAEISQYRFLQTHRVKGGRVVERSRQSRGDTERDAVVSKRRIFWIAVAIQFSHAIRSHHTDAVDVIGYQHRIAAQTFDSVNRSMRRDMAGIALHTQVERFVNASQAGRESSGVEF